MNSKQHSCSITLLKALFFKLHTIFKLCLCKRNCNSGIFSSSAILFSVKQCKIISSLKYQIYYYCAKQKRTHKTLKQDFTPESFFIKARSYFYCRFFLKNVILNASFLSLPYLEEISILFLPWYHLS